MINLHLIDIKLCRSQIHNPKLTAILAQTGLLDKAQCPTYCFISTCYHSGVVNFGEITLFFCGNVYVSISGIANQTRKGNSP